MAEEPFDADRLEATSFDVVRRGFDPTEVREHLREAGEEYHRLRLERDELAGRLAELDEVGTDQLEASRVATALGVEATHVLEAAHQAAVERAERAEREADAAREAALGDAESIRAAARDNADGVLADARRAAEEMVDEGRTRGRDMVGEAQTVRERILGDLARKRQTGRAQVEQLKAARDRLLDSLTTVQGGLDTAVDDLLESVPDARAAAERAGLRVSSEPEITAEHLEAEIEAARLVGHPLVDDVPDPGSEAESFDAGEIDELTDLEVALDDGATAAGTELVGESDAGTDKGPIAPTSTGPRTDAASGRDAVSGTDVASSNAVGALSGTDVASDPAAVSAEEPDSDVPVPASDGDGSQLYDVEADTADAEPETVDAAAQEGTGDDVSGVDVLFARLRGSHVEDESNDPADRDDAHQADAAGTNDPRLVARSDAAAEAAKALKKVLVDEQGTLLDGIRRSGGDAVHALIDDAATHDAAYDDAARPTLIALAGNLGADAVDLAPAFGQIHSIALDPVRQRLAEVADGTDDPDELSDTVRALYRESRSRRLAAAAAAAVVATDGLSVRATADGPVRWVVHPDGPCGPDCADNELAGEIAPGETFPTGDLHPPGHPACTCRLVPAD